MKKGLHEILLDNLNRCRKQRDDLLDQNNKLLDDLGSTVHTNLKLALEKKTLQIQLDEARKLARYYKRKYDAAEERIDKLNRMIWRDNK